MRKIIIGLVGSMAVGTLIVASAGAQNAGASSVNTGELGVVVAPAAGSTQVALSAVSPVVLHTAVVAFGSGAKVLSAQVDADEISAIYEVKGQAADGTLLEADISADGKLEVRYRRRSFEPANR